MTDFQPRAARDARDGHDVVRRGDEGMAMLMTIGLILVMSTLVGAALVYATNSLPQSKHGELTTRAVAAAQAGIDDYLGHLNQDAAYYRTVDCDNEALAGPNVDPHLASVQTCGWDSSTPVGWASIDPGDPQAAEFHYDVNTTGINNYEIWVTSTGRATAGGGMTSYRTLQARLSLTGSTGYVYYTDYEDADPENTYVYPAPNYAKHTDCGLDGYTNATYYWMLRNRAGTADNWRRASSRCTEIQFVSNDKITGPVHFNDQPLVNGAATFTQGFGTANAACTGTRSLPKRGSAGSGTCWRGGANPNFPGTTGAYFQNTLLLNPSVSSLKELPGCQYTGDTRLKFYVQGGVGKVDVWNTMSAGTTIASRGTPPAINYDPACGTAANFKPASGQRYPAAKQTIDLPTDDDGLVIVVSNSGTSSTCTHGQIVYGTTSGSTSADILPWANGVGSDIGFNHPTYTYTRTSSGWTLTTSSDNNKKFDCGQGNVYVEGTVKGRVTIASENNIFVTGDILVDGTTAGGTPSATDYGNIAGLIAKNSVIVYHPVKVAAADRWHAAATDPGTTVTRKVRGSGTATLTTQTAHGVSVGDLVTVSGVDSNLNGDRTVAAVTTNTVSWSQTGTTSNGTASGTIKGYKKVTYKQRASNVVTLTTATAHGFSVGDTIVVDLTTDSGALDGTFTVKAVPSSTTLTYDRTGSNITKNATALTTEAKGLTRGAQTCAANPDSIPTGGVSGQVCTYTPPPLSGGSSSDFAEIPGYAPSVYDGNPHRWIYASIQTLDHSFWVENYNRGGEVGVLSVRGSIAQRWRGIVGTGSIDTGYAKDYAYDERLRTTSPPYFPPWANSDWSSQITGETDTPSNLR